MSTDGEQIDRGMNRWTDRQTERNQYTQQTSFAEGKIIILQQFKVVWDTLQYFQV